MIEKQSKCDDEGKAKPTAESPVSGLNNNIEFMGKQLHVQTERIGFPAPRIVTEVFSNGRVVLSKKSEILTQEMDTKEFPKIQELMRSQHLQTIREIQEKQKRILGSKGTLLKFT